MSKDTYTWQKMPLNICIPEVHAADKSDQCLRLHFFALAASVYNQKRAEPCCAVRVSHTIENTFYCRESKNTFVIWLVSHLMTTYTTREGGNEGGSEGGSEGGRGCT